MAFKDYSELNPIQLDVLREIGNIGTGNAVTALSAMMSRPINIAVPKVSIIDYQEVVDRLGGPEEMIIGSLLSLDGDVTGMMMFLLQKDFAHLLLNALMGESLDDFSQANDMHLSAFQEIANIMAASYVNAIAGMTGLVINISVPALSIDMAGAIMSVPAIYYANISDQIIFIEDEFKSEEENAVSHILMIPDVESLEKIMTNLGLEL